MDYHVYHFTKKDWGASLLESMAITTVMSYLCYRSWYAMVALAAVFPLVSYQKKRKKCRERKQELTFQFKEAMQAVLGALMAGYSMENAFREAQNEMLQLYGQDTFMVKELQEINTKTALNEPLEKQLQNFAERSGIEDIETFCQVFLFAKRGGGDFLKIMKTTIRRIAEKIDVKREIDTMMAEKKLEQKVMQMVPVFILFYIDLTSPGFFEVMYGNVSGIAIMTGCLLLYLTALLLAGKITDVRV